MLAKIDVKKSAEARKEFGLAGLPTVIVANPGGEEIDRTLGYVPTGEFIETVEGYQKGVGTLADLLDKEKSHGKDAAFLFRLGERLYSHSRYDDADARFAGVVEADPENASGKSAEALLERASIQSKNEKWSEAVALCRELATRWPDAEQAPDAVIYAAHFAKKGGMRDEAITGFREYLERWPDGEAVEYAQKELAALEAPAAQY